MNIYFCRLKNHDAGCFVAAETAGKAKALYGVALVPVAACMVLIFASGWVAKTGEALLDWWRRHHE